MSKEIKVGDKVVYMWNWNPHTWRVEIIYKKKRQTKIDWIWMVADAI